ncbi:hypothetical protein Tco_1450748 [Tanacetum coccineum]
MVVQDQAKMGEDKATYKELDDSLMRVVTTSSSLEADPDSCGGPRCQETVVILLLKIELCTNLQTRVLDLEKIKTTQAEEIISFKRRVKKLEQKKRSRTHRLKRLYKVGITARVESSGYEESLGEDASKQGRINAIDADEDITLVNDQDDADMFDVNTLTGDEVLVKQDVATKDLNLTVDEVTLAQELAALKSVKSKIKWDLVEEPSVPANAASKKDTEFDEEERLARQKDEANVTLTEEWDEIQAKVDADYQTNLVEGSSKRAGDELEQEVTKKQKVDDVQEIAEVDDGQEAAKLKDLMKIIPGEEEVAIDAIPLANKPPNIVDWKIHKEGKKNFYQMIRADGSSKMYLTSGGLRFDSMGRFKDNV